MVLFYIFAYMLFMLDYALFVLLDSPLVYSLLALYMIQLYRVHPNRNHLLCAAFLLGLGSFAFHGSFGFIFITLIPCTALIWYSKPLLLRTALMPYVGLIIALLAQLVLLRLSDLYRQPDIWYTMELIFVNIGVMIPISLICDYVAGRQDNRL